MAVHYDFESLLSAMENDIGKSLNRVSKQVVEIWQNLIQENFYDKYNPKIYKRSYDTLNSIRKTNFTKTSNGYEVVIGYDTSLIKSEYISDFPYSYYRHENPEEQPDLVEYGWKMNNGEFRKGAHAFEEMINYVNSDNFHTLLAVELRKLGYELIY